jgi:spore germination cell wall hydrolase CwlJ-like protein
MLAEAALCMALTVYHEAGGEPYVGREAVAHVLHNRAKKYGTSICWEAFRYKQFSWTLYPSKLERLPKGPAWEDSKRVAQRVLSDTSDFTGGADHFHTVGLTPRPYWVTPKLEVAGQWGDHIFYRPRRK